MKKLLFLPILMAFFGVEAAPSNYVRAEELHAELQLDHAFGPSLSAQALAFSPDASRLAVVGANSVKIYASATGKVLQTYATDFWRTSSVAWSPDGKNLAVGGLVLAPREIGIIAVWRGGRKSLVWKTGLADIAALAWSPDGRTLASAGAGDIIGEGARGALHLWNASDGKLRRTLTNYYADSANLIFGDGGKSLALRWAEGRSGKTEDKMFDLATGREKLAPAALFNIKKVPPKGVEWRLESVSGAKGNQWHFVARQNGVVKPITSQNLGEGSGAARFGGSYLAAVTVKRFASGSRNLVSLWKIAGAPPRAGTVRVLGERTASPSQIAFAPKIATLAVMTNRGTALFDVNSSPAKTSKVRLVPHGNEAKGFAMMPSLSLSSDGKRLFDGRWLDISASQSRELVPARKSDFISLSSFALSPDGQILVGNFGDSSQAGLRRISPAPSNPSRGREVEIELSIPDGSDGNASQTREINQPISVVWAPAGDQFALIGSANSDAQLFLFDRTGQFRRELRLENSSLKFSAVAWSPDGKQLLSAADDGARRGQGSHLDLWDAATGKHQRRLKREAPNVDLARSGFGNGRFSSVSIAPDGKTFAAGGIVLEKGKFTFGLLFFDAQTAQPIGTLPLDSLMVSSSRWLFIDARRVAILRDNALELWDFRAHRREKPLFLVPERDKIHLVTRF